MKLTKCEVPKQHYKRTKILKMLESFVESDVYCMLVEYDADEYSSPGSCQASIKKSIKRYNFNTVKCVICNKKVYVFNEMATEAVNGY